MIASSADDPVSELQTLQTVRARRCDPFVASCLHASDDSYGSCRPRHAGHRHRPEMDAEHFCSVVSDDTTKRQLQTDPACCKTALHISR